MYHRKLIIDYADFKETVRHFYRCSLNIDNLTMFNFDFKQAFENLSPFIENKLTEHALTNFEDFLELQREFHWGYEKTLESFAIKTNYVYLTEDEIFEAIVKIQFETLKESFSFEGMGEFEELMNIMDEINEWQPSFSISHSIALFDRMIHAQHVTGFIFEDIDPNDIRDEIEEEYAEIQAQKIVDNL